MSEKNLKLRVKHKHDTEANWKLATNFKPLGGEMIIYDADSSHKAARVKFGDGTTAVNSLPFSVLPPADLIEIGTSGQTAPSTDCALFFKEI